MERSARGPARGRRSRPRADLSSIVVLLAAIGVAGCGGATDPDQAVLEERAGWEVVGQSFVAVEGGVRAVVRVVAPPKATLDTLTVRARLYGYGETVIAEEWLPLDVSAMRSGAGHETTVQVATDAADDVLALAVEVVADPGPEEKRHIVELGG